jgi:hypothetical protein
MRSSTLANTGPILESLAETALARIRPGELINLWQIMIEFPALHFIDLIRHLSAQFYTTQIEEIDLTKIPPPRTLVIGPGDAKGVDETLFSKLKEHCDLLKLDASVEQIARIRKFIEKGGTSREYVKLLKELQNRIGDQLKSRLFLFMPLEKIEYYKAVALFGADVDAKFPDLRDDIAEAGRCFAFNRNTAAVFHLMRVMERGVQAFAGKLGVPERIIRLKEWHPILVAAKKKIESLPQKTVSTKRKKEKFAEACAFLDLVRVAWRNPTMHPKASYIEEEAREILGVVKSFMSRLAKII